MKFTHLLTFVLIPLAAALLMHPPFQALMKQYLPMPQGDKIHKNKNFADFKTFYPFYQSQHEEPTNRLLHFHGTLVVSCVFCYHPRLLPPIIFAVCVGCLLCPLLRHLPHGIFEFAAVIITYLVGVKLSYSQFPIMALAPFVGYVFAWPGHFFFEKNQPATFIYPTYSLMSDFYRFARVLTGCEEM